MNLVKIDLSIRLDIRYATANNFTSRPVYSSAQCYLAEAAAQALWEAQQECIKLGLSLKVFDGYRPLSVQQKFWDLMPDERYVANPSKGSRHNRGCAIDLTLINLETLAELAMGTDFDDFSQKAHRTYRELPQAVLANRKLLEEIMHKAGFIGWENEWWHFDYKDWESYPVQDIPFEELAK